MPTQSIYWDNDTLEAVRAHAQHHDCSVSWAVRDLVRAGLEVVRAPVIHNLQGIRTEYEKQVREGNDD